VAEIYQNRTADKGRFFRGPSVAQIEKCKNNEICFRIATSQNLTSLKLEVLLGTKMK
jgi:hypothetical protein